ncbi:MAG TPA: excinuclease ABC subunit C, partial [Alphaproteobacteria bacterium]|nr:excinuclease ABC subunit C [Alphaproteobacteria bacterium]
GDYYGPFASAGAVNSTLNSLQKAFLLRSCSDSVFQHRTRPCLLHQIKRCSAPCVGLIDKDGYAALVTQAQEFLTGGAQELRDKLTAAMQAASAAQDFEQAALYRDRIRALSAVQAHQGINPGIVREADVFAVCQQGGQTCIQLFFFRSGQNWGNRAYFPRADRSLPISEILSAFIGQFYDNKPPPGLLLLSHPVDEAELLTEALSIRAGRKVKLSVPERGEKKALVAHALNNAREALERKLAESASQEKLLRGLADSLDLPAPPQRIEVYDNSHIQGTHPVGAMIVAGPDGFQKAQYRKFNIRDTDMTPGDDYAMMREVLTRRFRRLLRDSKGDNPPQRPDLVIIDGGAGQLNVARDILA